MVRAQSPQCYRDREGRSGTWACGERGERCVQTGRRWPREPWFGAISPLTEAKAVCRWPSPALHLPGSRRAEQGGWLPTHVPVASAAWEGEGCPRAQPSAADDNRLQLPLLRLANASAPKESYQPHIRPNVVLRRLEIEFCHEATALCLRVQVSSGKAEEGPLGNPRLLGTPVWVDVDTGARVTQWGYILGHFRATRSELSPPP